MSTYQEDYCYNKTEILAADDCASGLDKCSNNNIRIRPKCRKESFTSCVDTSRNSSRVSSMYSDHCFRDIGYEDDKPDTYCKSKFHTTSPFDKITRLATNYRGRHCSSMMDDNNYGCSNDNMSNRQPESFTFTLQINRYFNCNHSTHNNRMVDGCNKPINSERIGYSSDFNNFRVIVCAKSLRDCRSSSSTNVRPIISSKASSRVSRISNSSTTSQTSNELDPDDKFRFPHFIKKHSEIMTFSSNISSSATNRHDNNIERSGDISTSTALKKQTLKTVSHTGNIQNSPEDVNRINGLQILKSIGKPTVPSIPSSSAISHIENICKDCFRKKQKSETVIPVSSSHNLKALYNINKTPKTVDSTNSVRTGKAIHKNNNSLLLPPVRNGSRSRLTTIVAKLTSRKKHHATSDHINNLSTSTSNSAALSPKFGIATRPASILQIHTANTSGSKIIDYRNEDCDNNAEICQAENYRHFMLTHKHEQSDKIYRNMKNREKTYGAQAGTVEVSTDRFTRKKTTLLTCITKTDESLKLFRPAGNPKSMRNLPKLPSRVLTKYSKCKTKSGYHVIPVKTKVPDILKDYNHPINENSKENTTYSPTEDMKLRDNSAENKKPVENRMIEIFTRAHSEAEMLESPIYTTPQNYAYTERNNCLPSKPLASLKLTTEMLVFDDKELQPSIATKDQSELSKVTCGQPISTNSLNAIAQAPTFEHLTSSNEELYTRYPLSRLNSNKKSLSCPVILVNSEPIDNHLPKYVLHVENMDEDCLDINQESEVSYKDNWIGSNTGFLSVPKPEDIFEGLPRL